MAYRLSRGTCVDYITDQGEKHQRAWEAELLAFSGTLTLVWAAIRGPIAADAAMEHESPALAMSLGGTISRVYDFSHWLALVIP